MIESKYSTAHPMAGKTVMVVTATPLFHQVDKTVSYRVEDWWIRATGKSWTVSDGNPACLTYAMRSALSGLPIDDQVVYGHTADGLGHLVHVSEFTEVKSGE